MNTCLYLQMASWKRWLSMLVLLVATCFMHPASAQSSGSVIDAACTPSLTNIVNVNLQFNPGLGLLPAPTQLTGNAQVSCVFTSNGSTHTANVPNITGSGNLSCTINTSASGSFTFNWDDGTQSEMSWGSINIGITTLPTVPRVFVLEATVESGKFAGDTMLLQYDDLPSLNYLGCLDGTLTNVSGPAIVTFSSPLSL
jgi:hypothetical protein